MKKRRYLVGVFLILILGCNKSQFSKADLPNKDLIDSVIISVINHDSIKFVNKDSISLKSIRYSYALYDSILDFKVITLNDLKKGFNFNNSFIIDWLTKHKEFKINNDLIFNSIDSSFMLFQSNNFRFFKFDSTLFPKVMIVNKDFIKTRIKEHRNKENIANLLNNDFWWIKIHQPLFSYDKNYAIIGFDIGCVWGDCSFGDLFILHRIKNKWIVIKTIRRFQA